MLAFIMVFTGMGIGSWGVDTAWAASSSNRYVIQDVIGFTKESLDAQNLFYYGTPPAGDGQKIGTFNGNIQAFAFARKHYNAAIWTPIISGK